MTVLPDGWIDDYLTWWMDGVLSHLVDGWMTVLPDGRIDDYLTWWMDPPTLRITVPTLRPLSEAGEENNGSKNAEYFGITKNW